MEKIRSIKINVLTWRLVQTVFVPAFLLYWIAVWCMYLGPENYRELCDPVSLDQKHHFRIDDNDACDIRWMYLLKEPVFFTVIFTGIFWAFLKGIKHILKIDSASTS